MNLKNACLLALSLFLVIQAPRIHRATLRSYVGSKVVRVVDKSGRHGGTGFYVQAPSGLSYILTNSHVCDLQDKGIVHIVDHDGAPMVPHKVLEDSDTSDLCLIEGDGRSGLGIGSETMGEIVYLIGHPKLQPLTMGSGELVGQDIMQVFDHFEPTKDSCNKPKHRRVKIDMLFLPMEACIISINSYLSNIVALPGSSGSPLVNYRGQLVGVLYAGDAEGGNWGIFVTLDDINEFLENR